MAEVSVRETYPHQSNHHRECQDKDEKEYEKVWGVRRCGLKSGVVGAIFIHIK